ncbi:uroporphyrinogen-III synthase [Altererythrobacter sp. MF3-039]|uniref:uroporphyrinogen-III synthase n=1 Tax=Altererythrobacter sp. MF3-039 TaxID=3252901 RepID=UPI00390CC3C4
MTTKLIIVRPEPGNAATVAMATGEGLQAIGMPLQKVAPVEWSPPEGEFDGLLVGSANVFRHGGPCLAQLREIPVYAVGEKTAEAARENGFTVAASGAGGLQSVIDGIIPAKPMNLLRLAGLNRVRLQLPKNISMSVKTVYKLEDCDIAQVELEHFARSVFVMLHSVTAAENFIRNCNSLDIDRKNISLAVIGPRVAQEVGDGWAEVAIATAPNDAALLELAKQLCNKPG